MDSGRAEEECRRAEARMRGHMFEAKEARRNLPFQRFWTTRSPGYQITRSPDHKVTRSPRTWSILSWTLADQKEGRVLEC